MFLDDSFIALHMFEEGMLFPVHQSLLLSSIFISILFSCMTLISCFFFYETFLETFGPVSVASDRKRLKPSRIHMQHNNLMKYTIIIFQIHSCFNDVVLAWQLLIDADVHTVSFSIFFFL